MEEKFIFKSVKGDTYKVEFVYDDDAMDPISDTDPRFVRGFIDTRFYSQSNEPLAKNFDSFEKNFEKIFGVKKGKSTDILDMIHKAARGGYVLLPIWGYSHSGYDFTASIRNPYDPWDSGLAGFFWCECPSDSVIMAEEYIEGLIEWITAYLNGEIKRVEVTNLNDPEGYTDSYGNFIDISSKEDCEKVMKEVYGITGEAIPCE